MIKNEITPNPQFISQIESWESIHKVADANINNDDINISEIYTYFLNLRMQEDKNTGKSNSKLNTQVERLKEQIQELNKANEDLQSNIDSCNKKIEQYQNKAELEAALKFKIRILIREKAANIIKQYKQQNLERKSATNPIEKRLHTKPVENLLKNLNNISTQVVNSSYNSLKDRIEAIANQVNLPSGYNQSID